MTAHAKVRKVIRMIGRVPSGCVSAEVVQPSDGTLTPLMSASKLG